VGGKIVKDGGPEVPDRWLGRDMQAISAGTVEWVAILVAGDEQIELARAQVLDRGVGEVKEDPAAVSGIAIGFREAGFDGLHQILVRREEPEHPFVVRLINGLIAQIEQRQSLLGGGGQNGEGPVVMVERFAFFKCRAT
jgi:hypothetical protein